MVQFLRLCKVQPGYPQRSHLGLPSTGGPTPHSSLQTARSPWERRWESGQKLPAGQEQPLDQLLDYITEVNIGALANVGLCPQR